MRVVVLVRSVDLKEVEHFVEEVKEEFQAQAVLPLCSQRFLLGPLTTRTFFLLHSSPEF